MALTGDTHAASKMAIVPAIPQRSLTYFADLNPADNTKFIEVRVYRKWIPTKVPSLIPTGFSCMLLDKKVATQLLFLRTCWHYATQITFFI